VHQAVHAGRLRRGRQSAHAGIGECRTSDITLAEFKTLRARWMHRTREHAASPSISAAPPTFAPTSMPAHQRHAHDHKESIALFKKLGVKMTPELKSASVPMPYDSDGDGVGDYTQEAYAQQMIDEYKAMACARATCGRSPSTSATCATGSPTNPHSAAGVYLDDANIPASCRVPPNCKATRTKHQRRRAADVCAARCRQRRQDRPLGLCTQRQGRRARHHHLDAGTLGILADGNNGYYYQTVDSAITREGDVMTVLDVLAKDVGILGIFSDCRPR